MALADVSKASIIAKVKMLVKQVIRLKKTFHILSNELPISMLSIIGNILTAYATLCSFKEPI